MMDKFIESGAVIIAALISGIAAYYAAKAEKNSRPVSNGFTAEVKQDLRELRDLLTTHLRDHANRD